MSHIYKHILSYGCVIFVEKMEDIDLLYLDCRQYL